MQSGVALSDIYSGSEHVRLSFITSSVHGSGLPSVLRLDGIYFNSEQRWHELNAPLEASYGSANAIIIQSEFDRRLITRYFGAHPNATVIHNGASADEIRTIAPYTSRQLDRFSDVWVTASAWRPHKRLTDNIAYFMEHAAGDACLVIAGSVAVQPFVDQRVIYVGDLSQERLWSLYRRASHLVHLAFLDHCPNVVVDARAAGCRIVCSSSGGTREIAGPDAIVIDDLDWDMRPIALYSPPSLDFSNVGSNTHLDGNIDINYVAARYTNVLESVVR